MANSNKIEEGKRFKKQLDLLGINQRKIAEILDGHETFVSRMINGKIAITYKTLHKIKKVIPEFDIDFIKQDVSSKKEEISEDIYKDIMIRDLKKENKALKKMLEIYLKKDDSESVLMQDGGTSINSAKKLEREK